MIKVNLRFWTTRTGKVIAIEDMTDSHLVNTIKYLRRSAVGILKAEIKACEWATSFLTGEMAILYAEQDLDGLLQREPIEHLLAQEPRYLIMLHLANKRHLDVAELYDEAKIFSEVKPTNMEVIGFSSIESIA